MVHSGNRGAMNIFLIIAGLALLYAGAEGLVRGSSSLSLKLGVQPYIVGLTVVAFGTSAPELTVSTISALKGHGDIAIGNVVGSNIFNIALIIGFSAIIHPLVVNLNLIKKDIPIMILCSLMIVPIVIIEGIPRAFGIGLFALFVLYILSAMLRAKKEPEKVEDLLSGAVKSPSNKWLLDIVLVIGGIGVLVAGSNLLVSGAIQLARKLNISEALISLTIISAGTSLPELATSVVAAFKKESDIAVGNIVGSNIFNVLCILGISSSISPISIQGVDIIDSLFLIIASILLLPLAITDKRITRAEGFLFLIIYAGYIVFLWPK